nr:hypothetical protein [Clostridia bacterium]
FVASVISDTAGFAGVECLRRTVGIAKIPEFGLLGGTERARAERIIIETGIFLIEKAGSFKRSEDYSVFLGELLRTGVER